MGHEPTRTKALAHPVSIERNHTWELVPCPQNRQVIGLKWIFKIRYHVDGTFATNQALCLSKGYFKWKE